MDIEKILEGAGLKAESFDRIRLGRGVIGKASYVAFGALAVLAIIGARIGGTWFLLGVALIALLIFVVYFVGTLLFASRNPGLALLEGADLIQWRQMEMGVKDGKSLSAENVAPPKTIEGPG